MFSSGIKQQYPALFWLCQTFALGLPVPDRGRR